jgi:rod shape determining protein RodA
MFESHLNERQSGIDWVLLAALGGLMLVGLAFIYSASFAQESMRTLGWFKQLYVKQALWYAIGLGLAAVLSLCDYRALARWSVVGYWLTVLLLIAVLIPGIGSARFGARRWIDLGVFQLQPSEFAKLAFIFVQAHFLSRPVDELKLGPVFLRSLGMTVLPFVLVLKEPDLGSALILLPIGLAMMFVAGVPPRYLARLGGGIGLVVALLLVDILFAPPRWQIKLEEYQRQRLLVYFGRDFAAADASPAARARSRALQREKSYNVEQAMISVGSGGLFGKGWRQGTQYALGFLPRAVAHNDFVFSVIAEESGFLGSAVVLGLYTTVLFAGLRIAGAARDRLGKLLAVGVVALWFSHVFINIGMNIRLMPVTGIPLPLLSYGGSSVLCSLLTAGILQNVHYHSRKY